MRNARASSTSSSPSVVLLARDAQARGIGMTIDAEEAERLELSLECLRACERSDSSRAGTGSGSPCRRIRSAHAPSSDCSSGSPIAAARIPVRLVKGAYWDTEIKRAQVQGLAGYPVFTRKAHTDVSYLACARALLDAGDRVYPMFATHNAHTIAWVHARRARSASSRSSSSACTGWAKRSIAQVLRPA